MNIPLIFKKLMKNSKPKRKGLGVKKPKVFTKRGRSLTKPENILKLKRTK